MIKYYIALALLTFLFSMLNGVLIIIMWKLLQRVNLIRNKTKLADVCAFVGILLVLVLLNSKYIDIVVEYVKVIIT